LTERKSPKNPRKKLKQKFLTCARVAFAWKKCRFSALFTRGVRVDKLGFEVKKTPAASTTSEQSSLCSVFLCQEKLSPASLLLLFPKKQSFSGTPIFLNTLCGRFFIARKRIELRKVCEIKNNSANCFSSKVRYYQRVCLNKRKITY